MTQNQQPPSSQDAPGAEQPMVGSGNDGLGQPNHQGRQQSQQDGQPGQQGSASGGSGQQQQFDSSSGGSFAGQIEPHMSVTGSDGWTCGTVDHIDGDRIKLTRDDSGEHRYVPLNLVEKVENNAVVLRTRGDQAFGMNAG